MTRTWLSMYIFGPKPLGQKKYALDVTCSLGEFTCMLNHPWVPNQCGLHWGVPITQPYDATFSLHKSNNTLVAVVWHLALYNTS